MAEVLIGPLAIAALVLGAAGVAKLRRPAPAARAAAALGLARAGPRLVRALAAGEVALAAWCLADPGPPAAAILAGVYASFAAAAALLARRQAACGCFGGEDAPATAGHWLLSALLAAVAAAGVAWTPHTVAWAALHQPAIAAALALGVGGAAYAVVVLYTQLPLAWSAWSGR